MPSTSPLTPPAAAALVRIRGEGHTVHWGRAGDGRTAFYWARVTPRGTATGRNVRAADGDGLVARVEAVVGADPGGHVVAALSDPLRSCDRCGSELSFQGDEVIVFTCPRADTEPGHTVVRAL